ncbi:hypothetical protein D8X77_21595 [Vibrio vulnificus]|nr:hypothetical protein [Vibrio vulnificus]EHU4945697.1 hypothetical protein [Vibrio vulnificus]MCU8260420.1 hypothetical protein [Vibrio vulnificus]MCU8421852.1 hypothetical protein [Vibrio vulnificus]
MLKEIDGELKQIRASNLDRLLKVVVSQELEKVEDFKFLYRKYGGQPLNQELVERECPSWNNRYLIAQTFTAMTLEAFYYDYYVEKESKNKSENEHKQPLARFVYLAESYLNQSDVEKSDLYSKLQALNLLRRHWVHHKSTEIGKYSNPESFFTPGECINLIIEVLSLFEKHDQSYLLSSITKKYLVSVQENVIHNINSVVVTAT